MAGPTCVSDIVITPIQGKRYFNLEREWREEFIYFVMVDRFHDGETRPAVNQPGRSHGFATPDDFYGGKIRGITQNLDYTPDSAAPPSGSRRCSRTTPARITATTSTIT